MFKYVVRRYAALNAGLRAFVFAWVLCLLILLGPASCSSGAPLQQEEDKARKAEVVRELDTARKVVALTFDAGADAGYTEQILHTLKAKGIRASFGLTGEWAEANPELLRRIVDEGHTIINHSYSHSSFTGFSTDSTPLSFGERAYQLRKAESSFRSIAGVSAKPYFRPPHGDFDAEVLRDLYALGYRYNVMWSVDSLGWKGLKKEQILKRVLDGLRPGTIYLLHVGSQSQDGPALPAIISFLRERGYNFATIDDFYH